MTGPERIPIYPDITASWIFVLPSGAQTNDEQVTELRNNCRGLFEAFEDFIVPQQIEFTIQHFPPETPTPHHQDGPDTPLAKEAITLREEDGITLDALFDRLSTNDSRSPFVGRLYVRETATKIRLDNGDVYADKTTNTVEYRNGELTRSDPYSTPIRIEVFYATNYDERDVDTEIVCYVRVTTVTDVWFGNTPAGETNRRNLSAFLERMEEALPVAAVKRDSDVFSLSEVEEIY